MQLAFPNSGCDTQGFFPFPILGKGLVMDGSFNLFTTFSSFSQKTDQEAI